jgi:RHS repeat-associated protein
MATTYEYLSPGVINVKDSAGQVTQLKFTQKGELASIQDPLSRSTAFSYDANGYLSQISAPGNTVYKYQYDASGRLLSQTDPLNQTVSFTYSGSSASPVTVTDQKGNKLTYGYDASGNLTGITYGTNQSETFSYDASGRLTKATERSGDTFVYGYDTAGRLTRKTFKDGTYEAYTYDAKGNLATVRDVRSGVTTLTYDANNWLTKIVYPGGKSLSYAYDALGRRTQMKDQAGFTTNYSYDGAGRLAELKDASGARMVAYGYDGAGRLSKETNGNGTYTSYAYDNAGQLLKIGNYKADNTVNSSFEYTYDALGRQTTAKSLDGTWTYTYDATGQLTRSQLVSTNVAIANQDLQYVYDAAGNRIRTIENGVTKTYTTNALNQYTQVGSAVYTYDLDGNLTKVVDGAKTFTYTYNAENRLVKAVTPDGTFEYLYDALGNRVASVANGVRTDYLVDPFGLGDVVGEYNGASLVANYSHGLGLVGRFGASGAAYYDSDAIGSTIGLTNAAGSYVNRYAYRPFGEDLLKTEGIANGFEFVGQWGVMDEASGLDYMRARFYTPGAGKFLSNDPLNLLGGDSNFSRYASNNPTNLIDPQGTYAFLIPGAVSALIGAGSYAISAGKDFSFSGLGASAFEGAFSAYGPGGYLAQEAIKQAVTGDNDFNWVDLVVSALPGPKYKNFNRQIEKIVEKNIKNKFSQQFLKELASQSANIPSNIVSDRLSDELSQRIKDLIKKWKEIPSTISPLVLDLDNDGIELTSLSRSKIFFDLDADGFSEQTGWVKPDDGLLALDKNNNGRIDDITELFGNATTDGFIVLKQLDINNDNIIDQHDIQFADLRVWKDINSDGLTDVGELQSLAMWNINSINLNYTATNLTNEGNRISSTSTYTLSNGNTRQIVDVWFTLDQTNTTYSRDFILKSETLFLPTLRGYGQLPNLYISMSQDPVLLGMMRSIVQLSTTNYSQFHTQVVNQLESLLYRWAGADGIAINSRGSNIDARQLTFLEKLTGESFRQNGWGENPGPQASKKLKSLWNDLMRGMLGRVLIQGPMRSLFPETSFNIGQDSMESTAALSTILTKLVAQSPTDQSQATFYWNLAVGALDSFEGRFNLSQEEYDTQIEQVLANAGFSGLLSTLRQPDFLQTFAGIIFGTAANDTLNGTVNNDRINGANGNDVIAGLAGNDILDGGLGNDQVNGGDGDDVIRSGLGTDTVDGGNGRDTLELNLSTQSANLTITNPLNGTNLPGIAAATNFEFIKLTTGSGNDRITQTSLVNGTVVRSDETFNGGAGNDTLDTGLGINDEVNGGSGIDTLILNYGIGDTGEAMQFRLANSDINGISGSAGRIVAGGSTWLDSIGFSGIEQFQITGTRNNDTITTWTGNDILNGGAGNDVLDGGGGNDVINGGDGNDLITVRSGNFTLDGGLGSDILRLNLANQTTGVNFTITPLGISIPGVATAINFEFISVKGSQGNDILNVTALTHNTWTIGNGGNDTISCGGGRDRLEGGDGDDVLRAGAGNDTNLVNFPAAEDTFDRAGLYGGNGNDQLFGEAGIDDLFGEAGNDLLDGGDGDDYLEDSIGVNQFIGGLGNDLVRINLSGITTAIATNYITTTSGTLTGGTTMKEVEAFYLQTGTGADILNLTATTGNSWVLSNVGNDTVTTGAGRDRLEGGDGDDILRAGAGNDTGLVSIGNSTSSNWWFERAGLYGGNGNDQLFGEAGIDDLFGEAGNDLLDGGDGDDYLEDSIGVNQFIGGLGNDLVRMNLSTLTSATTATYATTTGGSLTGGTTMKEVEAFYLQTGTGADILNLTATTGNSWVLSGVGNDTVTTGAGRDRLEGGDGDDILRAGAGNDTGSVSIGNSTSSNWWFERAGLYGGNGNDILDGGLGDDYLEGGLGADRFIFDINIAFNSTIGVDTIADFVTGTDKIVLDKTTFTALTSAAGAPILASEFATINDAVNGATIAGSSTSRIIFNRANGDLFYNADGITAGFGTGGRFATLTGVNSLTAGDLLLQA